MEKVLYQRFLPGARELNIVSESLWTIEKFPLKSLIIHGYHVLQLQRGDGRQLDESAVRTAIPLISKLFSITSLHLTSPQPREGCKAFRAKTEIMHICNNRNEYEAECDCVHMVQTNR